jgi:hypothetical protein
LPIAPVSVGHARLHLDLPPPKGAAGAAAQGPALGFKLLAGPVQLPPEPVPGAPPLLWALGPGIAHLDLEGSLGGPFPLAATPLDWITRWRDGGGALTLHLVALDWGKLGASGTTRLALDANLQPVGSATVRLTGFGDTLDALAAAHAVPQRTADTAKAVLSLMARPQESGPPVVEAPLSLKDRTVLVGRIPLARMPPVQWSTAQ